MRVTCEGCHKTMACVQKIQINNLAMTNSIYSCVHCFTRVEVSYQGVCKEDISAEKIGPEHIGEEEQ